MIRLIIRNTQKIYICIYFYAPKDSRLHYEYCVLYSFFDGAKNHEEN